MNKPLLLTMTQERYEDISQMISNIYPTFDGIVAVVNQPSNDGTYELLLENSGKGRIIKVNWTPNHAFLMNHLLFYGGIQENQWCLYLDSPESCTNLFIQRLPNIIENFNNNGVDAIYWDDRPYLFKYNSYMEFYGAVHWGLKGTQGIHVTSSDKNDYIINRRLNNKNLAWCYNGSKYYVCYPLSNDVYSTYIKYGQDTVDNKEKERRSIRKYLRENLNLNLDNLNDLIEYMQKIERKEVIPDDYFINAVELNFRLSELYQLKVLNMDFMGEIAKRRHCWSFRGHLNGNGWIEGYIGQINKFNENHGLPKE